MRQRVYNSNNLVGTEVGSTNTEYSIILTVAITLVLPIVSVMKHSGKTFEVYAVALCGGGSDSTTATTDDNCYETYLHNLGLKSPGGENKQAITTPNGTPVGLGRVISPSEASKRD